MLKLSIENTINQEQKIHVTFYQHIKFHAPKHHQENEKTIKGEKLFANHMTREFYLEYIKYFCNLIVIKRPMKLGDESAYYTMINKIMRRLL